MSLTTVTRATRLGAVAAAMVAIVAGCTAPAAPVASTPSPTASLAPEPTASPTPTPAAAAAASVVVSSMGITVFDASGSALADVPFTIAPVDAIDQLSEALGETPTALIEPADACFAETTVTRWGGLRLDDPASFAAIPGAQFTAGADGATTAGGVPISAGPGFSVGEPASVLASIASVRTIDNGGFVMFVAELNGSSFDDSEAWGMRGTATSGVIEQFGAPLYYYYDC